MWVIIFVIGIAQGLFLIAILLGMRARNRMAQYLMAALVALFTVLIFEEVVDQAGLYQAWPHVLAIGINGDFAIGPLFYLFVTALLRRDITWRSLYHFVPLLIAVIAWTPFYLGGAETKTAFLDAPTPDWMPWFVVAKGIYLLVYIAMSWSALPSGQDRQSAPFSWLRPWVAGMGIVIAWIYINYILNISNVSWAPDSDAVSALALALILYGIAYALIARRELLEWQPVRVTMNATQMETGANRLEKAMREQELFLDPDLNLDKLAQAARLTTHQTSEVLNRDIGQSFYAYVNHFRLEKASMLLKNPDYAAHSVLDLALEAGFNSKASFYRAFREKFGMSPREFRKQHHS